MSVGDTELLLLLSFTEMKWKKKDSPENHKGNGDWGLIIADRDMNHVHICIHTQTPKTAPLSNVGLFI